MKNLPRNAGGRSGMQGRFPDRKDRRQNRFSRELAVLYEDDWLVALDKPAGLPAVPVKGSDTPSAWSLLSAELKRKRQRAFVVHRIDRFTSGVLLFAKTELDRDILVRQFLAHTPIREYLAVVRGRLGAKAGELVHYFRREGMLQRLRTESDPKAARAELRYSVERPLLGATLVRVALVTGLQNQIRVQFSAIGHPVVGDRKYHPAESSERRIARVALHAAHLQFLHPRSGESVSIDCELPPDFRSLLQALTLPARPRR
jgi:23S rRNA pseudouridine1911/1915/1917 synthase